MTDEGTAAAAPARVLLDECLPRRLQRELAGYDVRTVQELGWAGTKNGALLSRALDAGFSVLLTMDRSLEYQQHGPTVPLAIVLLRAPSNDIDDLRPLMPVDALGARGAAVARRRSRGATVAVVRPV